LEVKTSNGDGDKSGRRAGRNDVVPSPILLCSPGRLAPGFPPSRNSTNSGPFWKMASGGWALLGYKIARSALITQALGLGDDVGHATDTSTTWISGGLLVNALNWPGA
jgi:hypothetical protein